MAGRGDGSGLGAVSGHLRSLALMPKDEPLGLGQILGSANRMGRIKIDVEVDHSQFVTYAYLGTNRRVISAIRIRNRGEEETTGTKLRPRVTFESPTDEAIADIWEGADVPLCRPSSPTAAGGDAIPELIPPLEWRRINPVFNARILGRISERQNANILVEILAEDEVVWSQRFQITLLAANEWLSQDPSFYDALAAFVLPNSIALRPIMDRARTLLMERTGSSSTEGYQSEQGEDYSRALAIAKALYDAICDQSINYSNPPGAMEAMIQRVRSPKMILEESAATCLDSSVLYAAALAQAGLEPVLVLVKGHAFAGFFAMDPIKRRWNLPPAFTEVGQVADLVAKGVIQIVETTTMCQGDVRRTYEAACSRDQHYFGVDTGEFDALICVSSAWKTGIAPPPVNDGEVADELEGEHPAYEMKTARARGDSIDLDEEVAAEQYDPDLAGVENRPPRVRQWMSALLDLSARNNLLRMKTNNAKGGDVTRFLEFEIPDGFLGVIDDALFADAGRLAIRTPADLPGQWKHSGVDPNAFRDHLMATESPLVFPSYSKVNDLQGEVSHWIRERDAGRLKEAPPNITNAELELWVYARFASKMDGALSARVVKIRELAKEVLLATGTNALYLALGTMTWTETPTARGETKSVEWTAPLFLYPVILDGGRGSKMSIRLDPSGSITPNYCLLEKLRRPPYNLELPELEFPKEEELGIDIDAMIASVKAKLISAGYPNFVIQERCILGVFNYSTFRLWRDLKDHWAEMRDTNPVVRHLMYTAGDRFEDPAAIANDELDVLCPIDADDSQVQAIRWALAGRSFRLEGPPGTGKSQTITNLIASCLAHGKTVLFVAEKSTALQQVKKRLHSIGLGDYSLELHARGDTDSRMRKNISEQVTEAINASAELQEAQWSDLMHSVRGEEGVLDQYCHALHDPNAANFSLWQSRELLAACPPIKTGDQEFAIPEAFLNDYETRWSIFRGAAFDLPVLSGIAGGISANLWQIADGVDFDALDRPALSRTLAALEHALPDFSAMSDPYSVLHEIQSLKELDAVSNAMIIRSSGAVVPIGAMSGIGGRAWSASAAEVLAELSDLRMITAPHADVIAASLIDRPDLLALVAAATASREARWPRVGSRAKALVKAVGDDALIADPAKVSAAVLAVALVAPRIIRVRDRIEGELHLGIPADWSILSGTFTSDLDGVLTALKRIASADPQSAGLRIAEIVLSGDADQLSLRIVESASRAWSEAAGFLGITDESFSRWLADRSFISAWGDSISAWRSDAEPEYRFLSLQRWASVLSVADLLLECGLEPVRAAVLAGTLPVNDLEVLGKRGVLNTSVRERMREGQIDHFDGAQHDLRIAKYERAQTNLRQMLVTRIPGLLTEQRAKRDDATSKAAAQDLLRALNPGGRKVKTPIRTILEKHGPSLVEVMPCFMMSPDSIATLLPIGAIEFDLVVFDEASQVRTANAIGALGRGRASIVVGDSKQMPPTNMFSSNEGRYVEDDETDGEDEGNLDGVEAVDLEENNEVTVPLIGAAAEDVESILQEFAASSIDHLQLLCHYRSRDEVLIAFSNSEIYDEPMLTFPSNAGEGSNALSFKRVEGQFLRRTMAVEAPSQLGLSSWPKGTNPVEAQFVVDEVLTRLRDPARRARRSVLAERSHGAESIIVVTFNKPQMELIEAMLRSEDDPSDPVVERAFLEEKDDETGVLIAEPQVKVRNLENVQGDEAEAVIFSVAFSKLDPAGSKAPSKRVPLNFGPLTLQGGYRRLNVAVTRAQNEMVVFCSFDPSDMEIKDSSSEGARLLQKFLQLAKNGPKANGDVVKGGYRSHHIEEIALELRSLGFRVETQVGLSALRVDIAVGLPGQSEWALAIMVDSPVWKDRGSAFQRELLPKNVLTQLGWQRVMRVWVPSWIHERQAVLDAIKQQMEAVKTPGSPDA